MSVNHKNLLAKYNDFKKKKHYKSTQIFQKS
jgi:hypothetical protein